MWDSIHKHKFVSMAYLVDAWIEVPEHVHFTDLYDDSMTKLDRFGDSNAVDQDNGVFRQRHDGCRVVHAVDDAVLWEDVWSG